jgi:hydrogenase expression/formation protein HypC
MCVAVPMRIKSIRGDKAVVEAEGTVYEASICLTPQVKVGDYILLHTGYAIGIVDKREAEQTLAMLREMERYSDNESR